MPQKQAKRFVITRKDQLTALESPIRQLIVDVVAGEGPCTVRELADAIGRPAEAIHYHVRILRNVGLLVSVGRTSSRGRPGVRLVTPGRRMSAPYDLRTPTARASVRRFGRATLRLAERDFRKGTNDPRAVVDGPGRTLWLGRVEGILSRSEVEEVNRLINRLGHVFARSRRKRGSRLALTWNLVPA